MCQAGSADCHVSQPATFGSTDWLGHISGVRQCHDRSQWQPRAARSPAVETIGSTSHAGRHCSERLVTGNDRLARESPSLHRSAFEICQIASGQTRLCARPRAVTACLGRCERPQVHVRGARFPGDHPAWTCSRWCRSGTRAGWTLAGTRYRAMPVRASHDDAILIVAGALAAAVLDVCGADRSRCSGLMEHAIARPGRRGCRTPAHVMLVGTARNASDRAGDLGHGAASRSTPRSLRSPSVQRPRSGLR